MKLQKGQEVIVESDYKTDEPILQYWDIAEVQS